MLKNTGAGLYGLVKLTEEQAKESANLIRIKEKAEKYDALKAEYESLKKTIIGYKTKIEQQDKALARRNAEINDLRNRIRDQL